MQKLQNLRLIGYSKNAVTQWYILLATCINFLAVVLAIIVVFVLRVQYLKLLSSVWTSFEPASVLPTVLIGFGIFATLSAVNVLIIRKKVD
jgi:energy-converting hydrogenase Eha subunit A